MAGIRQFAVVSTDRNPDRPPRDFALTLRSIIDTLNRSIEETGITDATSALSMHTGNRDNPHHTTQVDITSRDVMELLYDSYVQTTQAPISRSDFYAACASEIEVLDFISRRVSGEDATPRDIAMPIPTPFTTIARGFTDVPTTYTRPSRTYGTILVVGDTADVDVPTVALAVGNGTVASLQVRLLPGRQIELTVESIVSTIDYPQDTRWAFSFTIIPGIVDMVETHQYTDGERQLVAVDTDVSVDLSMVTIDAEIIRVVQEWAQPLSYLQLQTAMDFMAAYAWR